MAYRSRSKFTPGGGVLAFFEQVSRFVSLSVVGWLVVSLCLILFAADGKITDSFDLRLVKGLFTNFQLFWTAMLILAFNGVLGGLIALPSAVVLLLCRQYLDYQAGRMSRRGGAWKVKLVRSLPVAVLLLSHALVLFFNLVSAPQLTRDWFKEESRFSSAMLTTHFVLGSLTRKSYVETKNDGKIEKPQPNAAGKVNEQSEVRRLHLLMLPADLMESDDFKAEQSKVRDSERIPFVISGSNIVEQLDSLFASLRGPMSDLFDKTLHSAQDYGIAKRTSDSLVLISLSPQLRFGRQPVGLGSDSLANLKDKLLVYESQRRLLLSQFQIFGMIRVFDGIPFFGQKINWLEIVSDDVARIRKSGSQISALDKKNSSSIVVIQLDSLENRFTSVHPPFRPKGWPLRISSHERRLVIKNIFRELTQYIQDNASGAQDLWLMLPYTDEKRIKPVSFAVIKSGFDFMNELKTKGQTGLGVMNDELGQRLVKFLSGNVQVHLPETAHDPKASGLSSSPRLRCFETEVDAESSNLQFQSSDVRERSLGELLNSMIQMPEDDLRFLSRGSLNLIAREPGFGFVCRTENQSINETFLLKYNTGDTQLHRLPGSNFFASILISKQQAAGDSSAKSSSARLTQIGNASANLKPLDEFAMKRDVLSDFAVYQLLPDSNPQGETVVQSSWRVLDRREAQMFFAKFEVETLRALETFARARIR